MLAMPSFPLTTTDALDRAVTLPTPPQHIVSLVPSQTELLAYLGLDDRVVGITRFCVRPEGWREQKTIVGGTKEVDIERVAALEPDLVLANHEENTPEDVDALADLAPVYVTDVPTVASALVMIRAVGRLVGRADAAGRLANAIEECFDVLEDHAPIRAAYLIWRDPFMTVGHDTIIHDIMQRGGFTNVFGDRLRYPEVELDALAEAGPDVLLLPDEPFPFDQKPRFSADLHEALPNTPVRFVDGELFSWYGPRLLDTPAYLHALRRTLQPDLLA
jgi:ABC-type Fe3+-hydroxamate transport system substrate-binding protein